jgi:hypothetical protein
MADGASRRHANQMLRNKAQAAGGPLTLPRSYIYATRITPADTFGPFSRMTKSDPAWSYYEIRRQPFAERHRAGSADGVTAEDRVPEVAACPAAIQPAYGLTLRRTPNKLGKPVVGPRSWRAGHDSQDDGSRRDVVDRSGRAGSGAWITGSALSANAFSKWISRRRCVGLRLLRFSAGNSTSSASTACKDSAQHVYRRKGQRRAQHGQLLLPAVQGPTTTGR